MNYPCTPGEAALREATVTIGADTIRLVDLSHGTTIVNRDWGYQNPDAPGVRFFPKNRKPTWLAETTASDEEARSLHKRVERLVRWANGTSWPTTCATCGTRETDQCLNVDTTRRLVALQRCFTCDYWLEIAASIPTQMERRLPRPAVADGHFYAVGPWSSSRADLRGFYGRTFKFKWFDGFEAESNDCWNGSAIPAHLRALLPDNAEIASR